MNLLERTWYRATPLWPIVAALLLPVSAAFGAISGLRRWAYRAGWLRAAKLPVPVIVVGNVSVGGTGKTPLAVWLARRLTARGRRPGIVSRGYRSAGEAARAVHRESKAEDVGDEPLLLKRASNAPVWIGADRVAAARALVAAHPECDVLISDDGLQHYRLARDVEIVVIDGERRFGNGLLLPAGPLRESPRRIASADAVVVHAPSTSVTGASLAQGRPVFAMQLTGATLRNLRDPHRTLEASSLAQQRAHAVAGIGNPQRFFRQLAALGLDVVPHAFPDHHLYRPEELEFGDGAPVVMTEKDGVKCEVFARDHWWVLPVEADLEPGLEDLVIHRIETP